MQQKNDLKLLRISDGRSTTIVGSGFSEYEGGSRQMALARLHLGRDGTARDLRPRVPSGTSDARISVEGGSEPSWRADGRELFYLAPDGGIMSVEMNLSPTIAAGRPNEVFRAHFPGDQRRRGSTYAVTADGHRFLIPTLIDAPAQSSLTVILNWLTAVKQK
jgi:hypothetical protein